MLADLALVGCYNMSYMPSFAERNRVMLASAKRNLAAMAFFGLTEHQKVIRCPVAEIQSILPQQIVTVSNHSNRRYAVCLHSRGA